MSSYTQHIQEERYPIYILKKAKHTQEQIAQILGAISRPSVGSFDAIGA